MTEEEAKTKWCPMVRAMKAIGSRDDIWETTNRDPKFSDLPTCIGSACMMWRWEKKMEVEWPEHSAPMARPADPPHGHCGLAGKP